MISGEIILKSTAVQHTNELLCRFYMANQQQQKHTRCIVEADCDFTECNNFLFGVFIINRLSLPVASIFFYCFSVTVKIWKIITKLRQLLVKSQSKHHFMLWVHAIIQNWIVQHTNIFFDNKDGIADLNRTLRGLILHIENCEKENYGQHLVGSSFFHQFFPKTELT